MQACRTTLEGYNASQHRSEWDNAICFLMFYMLCIYGGQLSQLHLKCRGKSDCDSAQSFSETHQICRAKCAVSFDLLIFCELLAFFHIETKRPWP